MVNTKQTYVRCRYYKWQLDHAGLLWEQKITWLRHQMETFSALLAICTGNSPVHPEFPHKGQWRGALMFPLICAWINGWVNNRKAGDLRRYSTHCDVTVMQSFRQRKQAFVDYPCMSMACPFWPARGQARKKIAIPSQGNVLWNMCLLYSFLSEQLEHSPLYSFAII